MHSNVDWKRIWRGADRSLGRITIAAVVMLTLLTASFVVVTSVLPAGAGAGLPSAAGVQPTQVDLGGQPNDCPAVGSSATYELRINNPQTGTFAAGAPAGVSFDLTVSGNDKEFDFTVNGPVVVFDIVVKGGSKSTHFDYLGSTVGPVNADQALHGPTKGNGSNLFSLSHVSFCFEDAVELSGTVLFDANADANLSADTPEEGRVVRAYVGGSEAASATTDAQGDYSLFVPPGGTVLVCEDLRDGYIQIGSPSGVACSGINGAEPAGYSVPGAANGTLDFDNALEVCGQTLSASVGVFDAHFELFADGVTLCERKAGDLIIDGGTVGLPIVGPSTGSVAGFGLIEKDFLPGLPAPPERPVFLPLEFSRDVSGTPFEALQWCSLRTKIAGDGSQFDPYVPAGLYPDLTGVIYVLQPNVSCKVHEEESNDGIQITIIYFSDDPYWR
jgi:hypothetical protein